MFRYLRVKVLAAPAGHLRLGQAGEEPELDHLGSARIHVRQPVQGFVHRQDLFVRQHAGDSSQSGAGRVKGLGTFTHRLPASASGMSEVTHMLTAIERGEPGAAEELLPLVYDELRQLAAQKLSHEKPGQTLQATALVHEAWLRLVGEDYRFNGARHFFLMAAEAIRRILVENARRKRRPKHGGHLERVDVEQVNVSACAPIGAKDNWYE